MAPKAGGKKFSGTDLLHGDDQVNRSLDVAPSISVSTSECSNSGCSSNARTRSNLAFRNPKPWDPSNGLDVIDARNPERHIYSRYTQDISTRAERVLSKINVRGDVLFK